MPRSLCSGRWLDESCLYLAGHPEGDLYHLSAAGRRWRESIPLPEWIEKLVHARATTSATAAGAHAGREGAIPFLRGRVDPASSCLPSPVTGGEP